ncbi:hypothetical protein ACEXQD_02240 [Herbiconiux sp. P15]|uniref:hypothetical protein n=1 Tax=Herbiconiux liukaitaii TaxID=3342799 RepID=UPI0035BB812A
MGESLIPSLVVLGVVVIGLAAMSSVLTRRSRRRSRDGSGGAGGSGRAGGSGGSGRSGRTGAAGGLFGSRGDRDRGGTGGTGIRGGAGRPRIGANGSGEPEIGGGAPVRVSIDDLLREAAIQLVRMDDALREGRQELLFARAEFGDDSVHDFSDALDTAERRASEAFALQQQLDDHVPDSEQQQRERSKRILSLTDSALALVASQSRVFGERRRRETSAPASLARLRDDLATQRSRLPEATALLADLAARYAPAALATVAGNDRAAAEALDDSQAIADDAEQSLQNDPLASVARRVERAESRMRAGRALLDSVERMRETLLSSTAARDAALLHSRARLAEAAHLAATVEDQPTADRIAAAAAHLTATLEATTPTPELPHPAAPTASTPVQPQPAAGAAALPDPAADLDALSAATEALDDTLAVARSAQQRLDSARDALRGALAIAESHIALASEYIDGRRGSVGSRARTRLASARRELEHARLEPDPVAALDAARRAATHATDADALARYDASGLRS